MRGLCVSVSVALAVIVAAGCGTGASRPAQSSAGSTRPVSTDSRTGGADSVSTVAVKTTGVHPLAVSLLPGGGGFALAGLGCQRTFCSSVEVLRSRSGQTWSPIWRARIPVSEDFEVPDQVNRIYFANAKDGWLYGGGLLATTDGGRSWVHVGLQATVTDLAAVGHETWLIGASCNAAGQMCQTGRVYAARAGSTRFRPVSTLPRFGSPGGSFSGRLVTHGHAVYLLVSSNFRSRMLVSLDAGAHWTTRSLPCTHATLASPTQLAVWSATGVVAVCSGEPGAGTQQRRIYASQDAGARWSFQGSGPPTGYTATISTPAAATWYIANLRGAVDVATNAGQDWRVSLGTSTGEGFSNVTFTDPLHGAAVPADLSATALWITNDAGQGWQRWRITTASGSTG